MEENEVADFVSDLRTLLKKHKASITVRTGFYCYETTVEGIDFELDGSYKTIEGPCPFWHHSELKVY